MRSLAYQHAAPRLDAVMPRSNAALALGIALFSPHVTTTAGEGACAALLVAERPFIWDAGATAGAAEAECAARARESSRRHGM